MKIITQYLKKNSYKNVIRVFVLLVFSFVYSSTTVNAQTYCTPSYWDGCLWDDDLNSFILTGHGASVLSDLNTGCSPNGYVNKTTSLPAVDLYPGQTYTVQINTTYSWGADEQANIWIDFNNNGVFEVSEKLLADFPLVTTPALASATITIPLTATAGTRRMRVRVVYYETNIDACSLYDYGETHDYSVNILSLPPCAGIPTAGVATVDPVILPCAGQPFTLSVAGSTIAGGITYQWESSPAGTNNFSPISGATNSSHTVTNQTADTDYRAIITCTNSNSSDTSNVVTVLQLLGVGNFSEDFDTTPVGSASKSGSNYPSCWSYIDTVTTGYGYVVASTPQSTPNVYRLYRTNATAGVNQELVLVSPQTIDLGNGTKQLRCSVRSYSTTTYINKVEILSMPSNTSTAGATVLATISSTRADQVWQEYIVPLPATTDDYFGFR